MRRRVASAPTSLLAILIQNERQGMKTNLHGPYELTFDSIEAVMPAGGRGVFALGYAEPSSVFRVQRVGRDGNDLGNKLKSLIGASNEFKYRLTLTEREAFEMECELFHTLRPPSNISHPDRPQGSDWRCPFCLQFHR